MTSPFSAQQGYVCSVCGAWVPSSAVHICGGSPSYVRATHTPPLRLAWTCPVCGNGCAPHLDVCSHEKTTPASTPTGATP